MRQAKHQKASASSCMTNKMGATMSDMPWKHHDRVRKQFLLEPSWQLKAWSNCFSDTLDYREEPPRCLINWGLSGVQTRRQTAGALNTTGLHCHVQYRRSRTMPKTTKQDLLERPYQGRLANLTRQPSNSRGSAGHRKDCVVLELACT